ncbi:MAG: hypothetical protein ABJL54_15995 [Halioglobus sp.]
MFIRRAIFLCFTALATYFSASTPALAQANAEEVVENICGNVSRASEELARGYTEGNVTQQKWEAWQKDNDSRIAGLVELGFDEESAQIQIYFYDLYGKYFWQGSPKWLPAVEKYGAETMITTYEQTTYKQCLEELKRLL